MRSTVIAAGAVAAIGLFGACGIENPSEPAAQPSEPATSTIPSSTPSTPSTPPTTSTPSTPPPIAPDCPDQIKAVRADLDKAVWGQGLAKAKIAPVSVTICQFDAEAAGVDRASVSTKRTEAASTELLDLLNAAPPGKDKPKFCTKELGPTYLLRFADADKGIWTYAVEGFGCRRVVATKFSGEGKPQGLAAPRQATPQLLRSLGLR